MASIKIKCDFEKVEKNLSLLAQAISEPKEILDSLGQVMIKRTQRRMIDGKDADGNAFFPLNARYKAVEKKGSGILIGKGGFRNGLMASLTSHVSGNRLSWGSNKIYANVHQFGAIIRPVKAPALSFMLGGELQHRKSVTIPARPYLGFSKGDEEAVNGTLKRVFGAIIIKK